MLIVSENVFFSSFCFDSTNRTGLFSAGHICVCVHVFQIIYRALCDIDCGEELLLRAGDSTSPDSDDEETAQVMAQGEAYLQRFTKKVCFTTHKDFCGATLFWRHILMHCRPLCFLSSRYRESGELCSVVDVRLSAPIRTDVLTSPNI